MDQLEPIVASKVESLACYMSTGPVVFRCPPPAAENWLEGKSIEFWFTTLQLCKCVTNRLVALERLQILIAPSFCLPMGRSWYREANGL